MNREEMLKELKKLPKNQKWLAFGYVLVNVANSQTGMKVNPSELSSLVEKANIEIDWEFDKDKSSLKRISNGIPLVEAIMLNKE